MDEVEHICPIAWILSAYFTSFDGGATDDEGCVRALFLRALQVLWIHL